MKTEAALVTALARGASDQVRVLARGTVDWERAAELAARHEVAALCSWMWDLHPPPSPTFERRGRLAYLHHLLRNEALENDLARIQDSLHARGIEALYFKGPWLAFRAYPDPGTRPVGDIDLGVREKDYRGALAALAEAGYDALEPAPASPEEALRRAHFGRQIRFRSRGRRTVELHFRLINFGPPGGDESWVWETARGLRVGHSVLRVPGPLAMLLHLLLHANQHGFAVLRLLHDIRFALVEDQGALDPAELAARARQLRCGASCYHALVLARDLAGAPVTAELLDAVQPSRLRRAVFERVWRLPAVRRLEASRSRLEIESPLLYFLEMGRPRERVRFLRGLLAESGGVRPFARRLLGAPGLAPPAEDGPK